jgi:hypothetical protein
LRKLALVLGVTATSLLATTLAPNAYSQSLPSVTNPEVTSPEINSEKIIPLYVPPSENETLENYNSAEYLFNAPGSENNPDGTVAQSDIELGRLAKSNYSFLGVGVNIGLDKDGLTIGDTGFTVDSKIAIGNNVSLRPSVIIANESAFLLPISYDFRFQDKETFEYEPITPYVGAGVFVTTDDTNSVGALLTAGLDYKLSDSLIANTHINLGVGGNTEVGLTFGVGYIFSGDR